MDPVLAEKVGRLIAALRVFLPLVAHVSIGPLTEVHEALEAVEEGLQGVRLHH